ncbi:hydrogenase maturation protease [Clostridium sp. PL3]|uniref:Hydrogenase maturation protease n=1 Tax=Clostridium thailandense TaxID=2794346 RepID=A0A949TIW2_9CLOT|nr:hydrogenase maturation protease [Clostridium thailandense]MBV7271367.1 hydrogenase maturation protease [Clostridium thailandense]
MKVKVIAIGNILMGDDGIGIVVAEKIKRELEKDNIEVIIGETDFNYCDSMIEKGDYIVILDGAYYGKKPGSITLCPIREYKSLKKEYSQHSFGLLDLISMNYKNVEGYIVGIEISNVDFNLGLSEILLNNFHMICEKTINIMKTILKNRE